MNWSGRPMSAESVASTNEPSSLRAANANSPYSSISATPFVGDHRDHYHRHQQQQQQRQQPITMVMSATSNQNPQASLPAYLAHTLVGSLAGLAGLSGSQQPTNEPHPATTINNPPPVAQLAAASAIQQQHQHQPQLPMANQLSGPLNLVQEQQQQQQQASFSDLWDEYWSRQPFPSGYTQSSITLLACFISTIIFLIVVGNLLVCIAIFTEKSLKPTQNWFIASLAVSDMLLGLVVMPFSLARELMGFWVFGPLWCDIHEALDVLLTTASINTLCLISLDRYWSITQAVSYLKKRTPRRGAFMIAFVWVFSAAVSLPPLFGWKKQQTPIVVASRQPTNQTNNFDNNNNSRQNKQNSSASYANELTNSQQDYDDSAEPPTPARSRRRRQRPLEELATPVRPSPLASQAGQIGDGLLVASTLPPSLDQPASLAGDYPTCQLSDDLGYVLYSALGSFYIPCAVMVFTYIKIFLAARSRARRAISKQSRGAGAIKRAAGAGATTTGPANRRANALGGPANRQQLAVQQACNASTISGQVTSYNGSLSHNGSSNNHPDDEHANKLGSPIGGAPIMKGGKIVIVERRKSLAASALGQQQASGGASPATKLLGLADLAEPAPTPSPKPTDQEAAQCILTTSGVKQASASALNSSPSNDSSMITVMHSSMAEPPPVTRFKFREPNETPADRTLSAGRTDDDQEGARKAAALLEAIRQVGANEQHLVSEVLGEGGPEQLDHKPGQESEAKKAEQEEETAVPDIVVERRGTGQSEEAAQNGLGPACCDGLNATSETCFMTIEEDSDMFDSQTGRTITMVAGNASQRQTSNLAKNQSTIVTMMPAAHHSTVVCPADATCRAARRGPTTSARSASSYCGSSLTINDDEDDDEDDIDIDIDECEADDDDEPLTDECNGYSCSVGYDHYCPEQDLSSTCAHCQECEQADRQAALAAAAAGHPSAGESLSPSRKPAAKHHRHHHQQQQQQQPQSQPQRKQPRDQRARLRQEADTTELQSITAEDNLSLTEYRSDDENSSIIGHDVLDATDSRRRDQAGQADRKKQSISGAVSGERKKSSIGFRLARLGSTAPLASYGGGLIALASSTQQQQQQQQFGAATRNLKALRQNFFLKLNQLTAKSATKQHETKSKKCASSSPTGGKSSAQSSGTSYEPSVDYATTSNIHSNEYPQETTIGDDSEQHSSSDQAKALAVKQRQQSSEGHNKDLINGPDGGEDKKEGFPTSERMSQSVGFARRGDKVALSKRGPSAEIDESAKHNGGINQMVGRISSGLVSTSESAVAVGAGTGLGKSQRFDLDNHHAHLHHGQHHGPVAALGGSGGTPGGGGGGKKRPTIGGHSSTVMSSSAGSGQPVGQRAYLASDNERHKRKLAKARERRATLILGLIMATFVCSWLPFFTFYVLRAICSSCKENVSPRFEAFIFWAGYCNSAINPIIYTIFNRDFRKAFRKILFKCV